MDDSNNLNEDREKEENKEIEDKKEEVIENKEKKEEKKEKEGNEANKEEKKESEENEEKKKEKKGNEEEKEKSEDEEKSEEEKESESEESKNSESEGSNKKEKEKEEENEEDEDDEDDDLDVDDDDDIVSEESSSESKQKDPHQGYLNSKTDYKSFYSDIFEDDYLYGFNQNKFYKIIGRKSDKKVPIYTFDLKELKSENKNGKKNLKLIKNIQYMALLYGKAKEENIIIINNNKEKEKNNNEEKDKNDKNPLEKKEEIKKLNEEKEKNKKEEEKDEKDKKDNKEEQKDRDKLKDKKDKDKKTKKEKKPKFNGIKAVIRDFSEYTFFQKIRIVYLNSNNNPIVFFLRININSSIKEICTQILNLYHYRKEDKYSSKISHFFIFINGKKHSTSNRTKNKFFIPTKFDYKNDYVLILERQNLKLKEFDTGSRNNYVNLRGAMVPHVVYNSLYNFEIDSLIITNNINSLECQIYELKKDINIRQYTDNERTIKQKLKDILDLNWEERSNFITTIKSSKVQKSKDNYNANLFELTRKFIMPQGKIYIMLIKSNNKRVYAFSGRYNGQDGIYIVSKNDKSLLSGFRAKTLSDFVAYS